MRATRGLVLRRRYDRHRAPGKVCIVPDRRRSDSIGFGSCRRLDCGSGHAPKGVLRPWAYD